MDEGGGDDDAGAEVSSEEVDVDGNAEAWDPFCDDREEGRAAGANEDDEEGGYSGAELAVVFVFANGHGTYHLVVRLAAGDPTLATCFRGFPGLATEQWGDAKVGEDVLLAGRLC